MREIIFYRTESGKCPVEDYLDSLTSKQSQKITWVLQLVEELPAVSTKYLKKLIDTEEIWEVRVVLGTDIFRLLGFFDGSNLIVLNHAFQKKSQKTPRQAIKIAEKRKQDYFRRKNRS